MLFVFSTIKRQRAMYLKSKEKKMSLILNFARYVNVNKKRKFSVQIYSDIFAAQTLFFIIKDVINLLDDY